MKRQIIIPAIAVMLASSCGEAEPLNSTDTVCTEFARHVRDGMPQHKRLEVVDSISEVISIADEQVADAFEVLRNTVDSNDETYQIGADTFAHACLESGWDG